MAEAYNKHKVVKDWAPKGRKPLPCCIYLDGVAVTKRDGVLGVWMYDEISEKRRLLCVLRKSALCKCGCRGADTLWPIFKTLQWSLGCLASGIWPSVGPDGVPLDGWRSDVAGQDLGVLGAVVDVKGDWMDFSSSLGLPNWADGGSPCPFCTCTKSKMFDLSPFNTKTSPWDLAGHAEHEEACSKAEVVVDMTRSQHSDIVGLLHYDKRKHGNRGRCLLQGYPLLGLQKGGRICPFGTMHDVADFDDLFKGTRKKTIKACFWRVSEETRARWRNPIFSEETGLTVYSIAINYVHTVFLGVAKNFCMTTIWHLIKNTIYTKNANKDERDQLGISAFKRELWAWYKKTHEQYPQRELHKLENLMIGMIGKERKPKLNTKAAETKTLTFFCRDELIRHRERFNTDETDGMIRVGGGLCTWVETIDACTRILTRGQTQTLYDQAKLMLAGWRKAKMNLVPKVHLFFHMIERATEKGNPRFYGTFLDESLNKTFRDLVRTAHVNHWSKGSSRGFSGRRWYESDAKSALGSDRHNLWREEQKKIN